MPWLIVPYILICSSIKIPPHVSPQFIEAERPRPGAPVAEQRGGDEGGGGGGGGGEAELARVEAWRVTRDT